MSATTVRVARFEVASIRGDASAVRKRWFQASDDVQMMTNMIWQTWLVWHVKNSSRRKLVNFLDSLAAWKKAKEDKTKDAGPKPKLDVVAIPKELSNEIYRVLAKEFLKSHARTRVLVQNIVAKKIKERKASKGNLSGWMAILLCNESIPSTTRPQPIPFDRQNSEIIPPAIDGENFSLTMRTDRIEQKGKRSSSTVDTFEIYTKHYKINSQTANLRKIMAGEYKFCGSQLAWDKKKRKWFAFVCFRRSVKCEKVAGNKTAILRPSKFHPWNIRTEDRRQWIGGRGPHVGAVRRRLLTQRWSRQSNYIYAGSSNKGHGLKRAEEHIWKFSQRWKHFVRNNIATMVSDVIGWCIRNDVSELVFFQPVEDKRNSRFLSATGKVPGRRDSTGWAWDQVRSRLAEACNDHGIEFRVKKCGAKRSIKLVDGHAVK